MQPYTNSGTEGWSFHNEDESSSNSGRDFGTTNTVSEPIQWTGSEFLDQHKNAGWYLGLFGALAIVSGVVYFFSKDVLSVGFIVVMGILFAIIASRKPRQLQYAIDNNGMHIGKRSYSFSEFKSFSLQQEGVMGYINLLPLKRLRPEISIFFPPQEAQRIFDALSMHIPHADHKESVVDKFTRFIRF